MSFKILVLLILTLAGCKTTKQNAGSSSTARGSGGSLPSDKLLVQLVAICQSNQAPDFCQVFLKEKAAVCHALNGPNSSCVPTPELEGSVCLAWASEPMCSKSLTLAEVLCYGKKGINQRQCAAFKSVEKSLCFNGLLDTRYCANVSKLEEAVCLLGGRFDYEVCAAASSLEEGLCLSSGRSSQECAAVTSVEQAICLTGKRTWSECGGVRTFAKALCLSSQSDPSACDRVSSTSAALRALSPK